MKTYLSTNLSEVAALIIWDCTRHNRAVFWSKIKRTVVSMSVKGKRTQVYCESPWDYTLIGVYSRDIDKSDLKDDLYFVLKPLLRWGGIRSQLCSKSAIMRASVDDWGE